MSQPKENPHSAETEAGFKNTQKQEPHLSGKTSPAQCGKAFAMLLFNCGAASFSETQAKFRRNPSWRSS